MQTNAVNKRTCKHAICCFYLHSDVFPNNPGHFLAFLAFHCILMHCFAFASMSCTAETNRIRDFLHFIAVSACLVNFIDSCIFSCILCMFSITYILYIFCICKMQENIHKNTRMQTKCIRMQKKYTRIHTNVQKCKENNMKCKKCKEIQEH